MMERNPMLKLTLGCKQSNNMQAVLNVIPVVAYGKLNLLKCFLATFTCYVAIYFVKQQNGASSGLFMLLNREILQKQAWIVFLC